MHAHDGSQSSPAAVTAPRVTVIGSANIDISLASATLPRPGETVIADSASLGVGGKGANQAAAAAACGARVEFVARVGDDAFGRMVRETLSACGVGQGGVASLRGETTGLATIAVDAAGQNCIMVAPGANARLTASALDAVVPLIAASSVLVLQCETPWATVARAIGLAAAHGTPVILNPAPCRGLHLGDLPRGITMLVPNETEAAQLGAMPVDTVEDALRCAARIRAAGIGCVIVTLGARGCVLVDEDGGRHIAAHPVVSLDATGAGDAFVGCLAASLEGRSRDAAVRRASVYASLSTTARGALSSYPDRATFENICSSLDDGRSYQAAAAPSLR